MKFMIFGWLDPITDTAVSHGNCVKMVMKSTESGVYRLMRKMNLQAIYPKPRLSASNQEHKTYPFLLEGLKIDRPNQVWMTDITYIPLPRGFVYWVAIIDVYSRYVVAWELSNSLEADFCLAMLEKALQLNKPEILNSDQGCQFTSQA